MCSISWAIYEGLTKTPQPITFSTRRIMNCHECNKAIIDNKFYYSFEDTNEICPKCYGIELDTPPTA